jgi:putative transposase
MRNALALVPKGAQQMVAATIRTVFVQPDPTSAREQWRRVVDSFRFRDRYPRLSQLLDEAASASSGWGKSWIGWMLSRWEKGPTVALKRDPPGLAA